MKPEEKIRVLIDYLVKEISPQKIILFGSRAKKINKPYSDIDLAIEGGKKLSFREIRKLKEEIDKIAGIYSVDLVFLEDCEENFKNLIYSTGKIIYEKN